MTGFIDITGFGEVQRDLDDLPRAIVRELFPKALEAGGGVLERELESRTPGEGISTSAKEYGSLRDDLDLHVHVRQLDGSARAGFTQKGMVALWVEYGHRQLTHEGKQSELDRVKAHPFMRPAADTAADAAIDAFADSLANQ